MRIPFLACALALAASGCATQPSALFQPEDVDQRPEPVDGWDTMSTLHPYPDFARRAGITGTVRLRVTFDETGLPEVSEVLRSPNEQLSQSATLTIQDTSWQPAVTGSRRVPFQGDICAEFRLTGPDSNLAGTSRYAWCVS